jgi:uncharacterized protein with ACT and thioredoxin-like domain
MNRKYTIEIVLDNGDLHYLRQLYGKRITCGAQTLVNIAVRRAVAEAAKQELKALGIDMDEKENEIAPR